MICARLAPAAVVFALIAGCGSDKPVGTVKGRVTLDGQPLAKGQIRFVPVDGKSAPVEAEVADGAFAATLPLGDMRVEVRAPKVVGKLKMYESPNSPVVDKIEEAVAARFNVTSTLTLTVRKGEQPAEFAVSGK